MSLVALLLQTRVCRQALSKVFSSQTFLFAVYIVQIYDTHIILTHCSYRNNTKAAVIRIGLEEAHEFSRAFLPGSKMATFFESCGIADFIVTCYGGKHRLAGEAFVKTGKVNLSFYLYFYKCNYQQLMILKEQKTSGYFHCLPCLLRRMWSYISTETIQEYYSVKFITFVFLQLCIWNVDSRILVGEKCGKLSWQCEAVL